MTVTAPILETNDLKHIPHVIVGGVKTSCLSRDALTRLMVEDCKRRRSADENPALVFDSNGHALSLAASSASFRSDLGSADIVHADGGVIVAAANALTQGHIKDRSATTDFIHDAAKAAEQNHLRFFLLGGTEEVNAQVADKLKDMYPGLQIVGRRHGYFSKDEELDICRDISALRPDIVWVGLGKPKEQRFCVQYQSHIKAGWLVTCGGCFNYITGHYARAPLWMQRNGLEWLYRVVTDPQKFAWRYIRTNPHALYLICTKTRRSTYTQSVGA